MPAVTICSDFGAQKYKVSLFPFFPRLVAIYYTYVYPLQGMPDVLQSMGSQRTGHNLVTEQQQISSTHREGNGNTL